MRYFYYNFLFILVLRLMLNLFMIPRNGIIKDRIPSIGKNIPKNYVNKANVVKKEKYVIVIIYV